jgi:hypothetical protein
MMKELKAELVDEGADISEEEEIPNKPENLKREVY